MAIDEKMKEDLGYCKASIPKAREHLK